jgi:hypothetical protein
MKTMILTTAILCAASLTAADINGKWAYEKQVGDADGKTYPHQSVFSLKNDGGMLTGSVVQTSEAPWMRPLTGKPLEISDGTVDGEKFSFKVKIETDKGERTSFYEGTIDGDQLKGTLKFRGIGITEQFVAKRVK